MFETMDVVYPTVWAAQWFLIRPCLSRPWRWRQSCSPIPVTLLLEEFQIYHGVFFRFFWENFERKKEIWCAHIGRSNWWFQRFFDIFTSILGEMIQFDDHIFSNGLKPPTSFSRLLNNPKQPVKIWNEMNPKNCWVLRKNPTQLKNQNPTKRWGKKNITFNFIQCWDENWGEGTSIQAPGKGVFRQNGCMI